MAQRPVVFLAFADDPDDHLAMIKREGKDIYRALQKLHDEQVIEIYREESADIEDIFYNFNRFKDRVIIFHYGGHADGKHLQLEGRSADAKGLAQMFGEQKNLQLVMLNGCSTQGQVEKLLESGVPAIVGTSVPINDGMATEFAVQLYQALASHRELQSAFRQAIAYLQSNYKTDRDADIVRGLSMGKPKETDKLPWGLYVGEGDDTVLDFKLPENRKIGLPEGFGGAIKENYKVNEYIITVLPVMAEFHKPILKDMVDEWGDERDPREYPELIIKNFPWPIGSQLRILVANSDMMNKPSLSRLKQLLHTYTLTSQFLSYILVSQLWDEYLKEKLNLEKDFGDLFDLAPDAAKGYDYLNLLDRMRGIFEDKKIQPFMQEYEGLFESFGTKDAIYEAYQFLHATRERAIQEQISDAEIEELCNQTEFCLAELLKKVAFLAKYRLVTVKDISLFKHRHKDALYRVQIGVLNAFDKEFLRERARDHHVYTDNYSVLIVRSLRDMDEYLNLSPFVIDKNAFAGKPIPNIYMYAGRENGNYLYLTVNYNVNKAALEEADQMKTVGDEYAVLREQFQMFSTLFN